MYYYRIAQKVELHASTQKLEYGGDAQEDTPGKDLTWHKIWSNLKGQQSKDPLLESLGAAFQNECKWGKILYFLNYQFILLPSIFAFYIFQNISNNAYNEISNIILVALIIAMSMIKPILRLYAERKLRKIGKEMHSILSQAIVAKTFNISLLSNNKVTGSELLKIMHVDMDRVIAFPELQAYLFANTCGAMTNIFITIFLFGWAGLVGIIVFIGSFSVRILLKKPLNAYEERLEREKGNRIRKTVDIFNIIKLIKVAALELPYYRKLVDLRAAQVNAFQDKSKFQLIPTFIGSLSVRSAMLAILWVSILLGRQFDSAVIFSLMYVFGNINFYNLIIAMTNLNQTKMSLKNIDAFLRTEEMDNTHITRSLDLAPEPIIVENGNFYWQLKNEGKAEAGETVTPARVWLRGLQLRVKRGEFVSVIGRFGSGKSSLLQALLGQMRDGGGSRISLSGRVAYAAQKPWIVNDTVRGNILFGAPFDPTRYAAAVHFSALKADLEILNDGDQTLIGERGCTLSGGQKARVALARALYADADVILLDDVLSAVDAHVGAFLFFETFGKHCRGKTIVMVTHALHYVQHTDRILIMDNCSVVANGTYEELKTHPTLRQIQAAEKKEGRNVHAIQQADSQKVNYDVGYNELEISQDSAVEHFLKRTGTQFKVATLIYLLMTLLGTLGFYSSMNSWANASDYSEWKYPLHYIGLMLWVATCFLSFGYYIITSNIHLYIYKDMVRGVLFAPLSYFQTNPAAKIVHRFSHDIAAFDTVLMMRYFNFLACLFICTYFLICMVFIYVATQRYTSLFIFAFLISVAVQQYKKYYLATKAYMHTADQLKIPINTSYAEIVQGQTTIRAYGKIPEKKGQFVGRLSSYYSVKTVVGGIQSLTACLVYFFSAFYMTFIIIQFFFVQTFTIYDGFLLANIFLMETYLGWINDTIGNFYIQLKCLTKCEELIRVKPEEGYKQLVSEWDEKTAYEKATVARSLSPFTRGEIEFKGVSVSYRPELGDVLRGVSFKVKAGEKVGVVGRTGSGKSTLFLALLRIVSPRAGVVLVDGVDCSLVGLTSLRASVNFILQQHFLFGGSVRENADPSGVHSDEEITHVLGLCGLWEGLQRREGLETAVTEGGENLSAGERQLLNIARALLSRRRVVLVDEATASIDSQSDAAIQRVLRTHFAESTVLTIAHRLDSVAHCDRILGLEAGEVKEFDSPANLLKRKDSLYQQLCEQTNGKKEI